MPALPEVGDRRLSGASVGQGDTFVSDEKPLDRRVSVTYLYCCYASANRLAKSSSVYVFSVSTNPKLKSISYVLFGLCEKGVIVSTCGATTASGLTRMMGRVASRLPLP